MGLFRVEDSSGDVVVLNSPLDVIEICETCWKQGIIYPVHEVSMPHQGSPHFKPLVITPQMLREQADELEAKLRNGKQNV